MTAGEIVAYLLLAAVLIYHRIASQYQQQRLQSLQQETHAQQEQIKEARKFRKMMASKEPEQQRREQSQLEKLREKNKAMQQQLDDVQANQHELKQALAQAHQQVQIFSAKNATLEQRCEQLKAAHAAAVQTLKEKENQPELPQEDTQDQTLRDNMAKLEQETAQQRKLIAEQRDKLQSLRKKHDNLRRLDTIGKAKLKLIEDKLRQLSKDYYNVISENAALRGEVSLLPRSTTPARQPSKAPASQTSHA